MLESCWGNLLEADAEALVNTVNCVGVMGKGLALQFKKAYPENFEEYQLACQADEVKPGQMFIVPTGRFDNPRFIINFPTKRHWRNPSQLGDIKIGLDALVETVKQLNIRSIAIPPLGCGNGGLDWSEVAPLIEDAFAQVPDVRVLVYEPPASVKEESIVSPLPELTRGRALLIALMAHYQSLDNSLTLLEVQKLAYLLQATGEPLRLQFLLTEHGPSAANLHPVLNQLQGHYLEGYRNDDRAKMHLLAGAEAEAEGFLAGTPAIALLDRVIRLIEGYETSYGLEVLSIVHWVMQTDPQSVINVERAIAAIKSWHPAQQGILKPQHIQKAWQRLQEQRWVLSVEPA
jgi:O-acetyl-ADP-ribose deacetylase (regulator of RNase III)